MVSKIQGQSFHAVEINLPAPLISKAHQMQGFYNQDHVCLLHSPSPCVPPPVRGHLAHRVALVVKAKNIGVIFDSSFSLLTQSIIILCQFYLLYPSRDCHCHSHKLLIFYRGLTPHIHHFPLESILHPNSDYPFPTKLCKYYYEIVHKHQKKNIHSSPKLRKLSNIFFMQI